MGEPVKQVPPESTEYGGSTGSRGAISPHARASTAGTIVKRVRIAEADQNGSKRSMVFRSGDSEAAAPVVTAAGVAAVVDPFSKVC